MKKIVFFITVIFSLQAKAQYSPYTDPYYYNPYIHNRQALEQAAEAGRRARAEAERQAKNNPDLVWSKIVEKLGMGYYKDADDLAQHLANNLQDGRGYWMTGMLSEMGIGCPRDIRTATYFYKLGTRSIPYSKLCKIEYERVRKKIYYTSKDGEKFKNYYTNLVYSTQQMVNSIIGNPFSSSSSSSSKSYNSNKNKRSSVCSNCNGTGVEPSQSSGGDLSLWKRYYNSPNLKCPYCSRYNEHWHIRCPSCNAPHY